MSFLKSSLSFAERFLDDLDKKAEGGSGTAKPATGSTTAATVASDAAAGAPAFTRRPLVSAEFGGFRSTAGTVEPPSRPASASSGSGSVSSYEFVQSASSGVLSVGGEDGAGGRADDGLASRGSDVSRHTQGFDAGGAPVSTSSTTSLSSRRGSERHSRGDDDTVTALRDALREREVRLLEATAAMEALTRNNSSLSADLDDMEAALVAARLDLDRAKRREESLEKQIKDAYHEVGSARTLPHAFYGGTTQCSVRIRRCNQPL